MLTPSTMLLTCWVSPQKTGICPKASSFFPFTHSKLHLSWSLLHHPQHHHQIYKSLHLLFPRPLPLTPLHACNPPVFRLMLATYFWKILNSQSDVILVTTSFSSILILKTPNTSPCSQLAATTAACVITDGALVVFSIG